MAVTLVTQPDSIIPAYNSSTWIVSCSSPDAVMVEAQLYKGFSGNISGSTFQHMTSSQAEPLNIVKFQMDPNFNVMSKLYVADGLFEKNNILFYGKGFISQSLNGLNRCFSPKANFWTIADGLDNIIIPIPIIQLPVGSYVGDVTIFYLKSQYYSTHTPETNYEFNFDNLFDGLISYSTASLSQTNIQSDINQQSLIPYGFKFTEWYEAEDGLMYGSSSYESEYKQALNCVNQTYESQSLDRYGLGLDAAYTFIIEKHAGSKAYFSLQVLAGETVTIDYGDSIETYTGNGSSKLMSHTYTENIGEPQVIKIYSSVDNIESIDLCPNEELGLYHAGMSGSFDNFNSQVYQYANKVEKIKVPAHGYTATIYVPILNEVTFESDSIKGIFLNSFSTNTSLTSLSLPDTCTGTAMSITGFSALTELTMSQNLSSVELLECNNNALNAASIDGILINTANSTAVSGGQVILNGGTNAAPTSASTSSIILLENKDWVVTTN